MLSSVLCLVCPVSPPGRPCFEITNIKMGGRVYGGRGLATCVLMNDRGIPTILGSGSWGGDACPIVPLRHGRDLGDLGLGNRSARASADEVTTGLT